MNNDLPQHAEVVVIGAGIVGASSAYHLAKMGWKDVVVLEGSTIGSGSSDHAAGLVTQLRHTRALTDISRYGVQLYEELKEETGLDTGFRQPGSITVARTQGRMDELRHNISMARGFGVEMNEISLGEAKRLWPMLNTGGLVGAVHLPRDGETQPDNTTKALAAGATQQGVKIFENTRVTGILTNGGAVTGVSTSRGDITCDVVLNCAGMWAREIGLMCGVTIPLHAAEHAYFVTEPMPGVTEDMPSLRDHDGYIYARRYPYEGGGLLIGGFEPVSKPWGMDGIPEDFALHLRDQDWSHYEILMENARERIPAVAETGVKFKLVGPESFTPDNGYIMGEAPGLRNFFVAAGMNSSGVASAAGAGRAIAEWITEGDMTMDLAEVDVARFQGWSNNPAYLRDRTVETLGLVYAMHWPNKQPETARNVRQSPLHQHLVSQRACFGVVAGWERPNWYAPEGVDPVYEYAWGRQNWFDYSAQEHMAVREAVGLFDQTSFAKFLLQGADAESVLQRLMANDVAVEPGRLVYTAMLNTQGGIVADLTVNRISEDTYMIVTSAASANRDFAWIKRHIASDARATLTDVSSSYAVLSVMGPRSRDLLSRLTNADLSNEAFPFLTSQEIYLGYAPVRASRITYVGELGWELYVPTEYASTVYESIVQAGGDFGLMHAGYHALESLRLEKAYRSWGHDICNVDTPLEAGLGFAVAFDKDVDFIGKDALLRQREKGLDKRMAVFVLEDPEPLLFGDEPIYRDGVIVGCTTSGNYGHALGRSVAMGYVENDEGVTPRWIRSGAYEIELATERYPAKVRLTPPYDPKSERIRA